MSINYDQELILRIQQYFFSQFLDAVTNTNPYEDANEEYLKKQKTRSIKSKE